MNWLLVVFGASMLLSLLLLIYIGKLIFRKDDDEDDKPVPRELQLPQDWHTGKHFGELFYSPEHRCNCVVVYVVAREDWYYVTQKEPTVVRHSVDSVARIVRAIT